MKNYFKIMIKNKKNTFYKSFQMFNSSNQVNSYYSGQAGHLKFISSQEFIYFLSLGDTLNNSLIKRLIFSW